MSDVPQKISDRYELVSRLGEGGMGVVWRGRDTRLGRAVAVKLLSADSVGSDVARKRLIREAQAAAALEHPGIVHVYDAGETDDGGAFLVMELVRGRSLRAVLASSDVLSIADRVQVIIDAARALHFAHQAGIVHRDVKPDNIMIRDDGRVVVVDFGVAKPVSSAIVANAETVAGVTSKSLTARGQLVGTPAYLAPEQARGVAIGHATDQFALAVTAFEALTGKLPWKGDGVVEVVASLLRDESPPVSSNPEVPAAFDPILSRALAKEPKDRWPDMGAFADALEAAADAFGPSSGRASKPSKRVISVRTPEEVAAIAKTVDPGKPTPAAEISSTKISGADSVRGDAIAKEAPPPSRQRMFAAIAVAGVIGVLGWAFVTGRVGGSPQTSADAGSAVAPGAGGAPIYACPSFDVPNPQEAWIGAAAASLACERMQIAHGGIDARTLVPAELTGITRELSGATASGSYDGMDVREKAIAVAKQRGTRWLDGRLDRQGSGYYVSIVLRSDTKEIARGEGRGVELFEAVRSAIVPIVRVEPPTAAELATMQRELDVGSVEDAFALFDVHTSVLIEDVVSLKDACTALSGRTTIAPRAMYLARVMCTKKLRTGIVTEPPPAIDESTPAALITTTLAHATAGGPAAVRERAERLEAASKKASDAETQARLSAAAAELFNAIGDERGRKGARVAIQSSPKAFDWRTSAWHRLAFASEGDLTVSGAIQAWQPWEPVSQSLRGILNALHDAGPNGMAYNRAYLLSQRGVYAQGWSTELLNQGKVEAARSLAELAQDDLMRVDVMLGEAKYANAFATVPRMLHVLPGDDEHAAQAFLIAQRGVYAAEILDRPADFVEELVQKFILSDPHHIVDGVVPFNSLVASCCLAPRPTGKACAERLLQLRADAKLPTIFAGADTVVAGAARFIADDYAGAAKAWRTLLRAPGWIQDPLRDVMAIAFERAGAADLAEEVDGPTLAFIDYPRTADLAWVRAAKRAEKRGDKARARKLAQAVVDKWRFADEDIPSVREMKALLSKLPP
jgi:serine/threonine-protein kinase